LDALMNRNLLFTTLYAWGRTLDTEELVGVTSRSPRYYVSAAYWDRDAMLWSFPGVLDSDPQFARQVLEYALGIQLRNTGTHSRFIDGVVLEDGFQLDEAVAPIVALAAYARATLDTRFLEQHRDAVATLRGRLEGRFDPATGMYSSLQDSQDEFQKLPFLTYDNALAWRALRDLGELYDRLHEGGAASDARRRAAALREAVLRNAVVSAVEGGGGPILGSATDGKQHVTTDIPPGSLLKLPILGFLAEDDPLFRRTFEWLHSANYRYSYSDRRYGLPGSYRLPFTTSWTIADELMLKRAHDKAEQILLASPWDAGIITEGIDPDTAIPDKPGRAFATAAGYVAHAICATACLARH
ncbi:MAG TPA: glycoside hydrolase family 125 protein, partial [Steroidobacteraceae bacterium]|nr:glycoside hydrolase family 125 protein [Steroidobacteraceae bacterium]